MANCWVWLTLVPEFQWGNGKAGRGKQVGWKAAKLTQTQPKSGFAIQLRLDIPIPRPAEVVVDERDIQVMTLADVQDEEVVRGLEPSEDH